MLYFLREYKLFWVLNPVIVLYHKLFINNVNNFLLYNKCKWTGHKNKDGYRIQV